MLNNILLIVCVFCGFLPLCLCLIYSCLVEYRENKKFRERVLLLLFDIKALLYSSGGDVIEEG